MIDEMKVDQAYAAWLQGQRSSVAFANLSPDEVDAVFGLMKANGIARREAALKARCN